MAKNEYLQYGNKYLYDVLLVQRKLNELGYLGADGKPLAEDGSFGNNTLYAVKNFQEKNGLDVDGFVGKQTWSALGLPFDGDMSIGSVASTGVDGWYSEGLRTNIFFPSSDDKKLFVGLEFNLAEVGNDVWTLSTPKLVAKAGMSAEYKGADVSFTLYGGSVSFDLPFRVGEKDITVTIDLGVGAGVGFPLSGSSNSITLSGSHSIGQGAITFDWN